MVSTQHVSQELSHTPYDKNGHAVYLINSPSSPSDQHPSPGPPTCPWPSLSGSPRRARHPATHPPHHANTPAVLPPAHRRLCPVLPGHGIQRGEVLGEGLHAILHTPAQEEEKGWVRARGLLRASLRMCARFVRQMYGLFFRLCPQSASGALFKNNPAVLLLGGGRSTLGAAEPPVCPHPPPPLSCRAPNLPSPPSPIELQGLSTLLSPSLDSPVVI